VGDIVMPCDQENQGLDRELLYVLICIAREKNYKTQGEIILEWRMVKF